MEASAVRPAEGLRIVGLEGDIVAESLAGNRVLKPVASQAAGVCGRWPLSGGCCRSGGALFHLQLAGLESAILW